MTFEQEDDGGLGGAIVTNIINELEGVRRTTIEGELNGVVCDEMGRLDDALDDMLAVVLSMIDNVFFLGGRGNDVQQDPLSAKEDAAVPTDDDGLPMWIDFVELQDFVQSLTGLELMDNLAQQFMGEDVSVIIDALLGGQMKEEGYIILDPSMVFGMSSESKFEDMFTQPNCL